MRFAGTGPSRWRGVRTGSRSGDEHQPEEDTQGRREGLGDTLMHAMCGPVIGVSGFGWVDKNKVQQEGRLCACLCVCRVRRGLAVASEEEAGTTRSDGPRRPKPPAPSLCVGCAVRCVWGRLFMEGREWHRRREQPMTTGVMEVVGQRMGHILNWRIGVRDGGGFEPGSAPSAVGNFWKRGVYGVLVVWGPPRPLRHRRPRVTCVGEGTPHHE